MAGTWTCSEDEDFGSLGDNKVIVINGTSSVPATFADFVTADRAGEAVLLAATAGLSPTLALTYAIRPVEDLALLISFIVASKTAEADFIFITGTDFAGNAQTESLDVTAGNGTYVTTKYFATISNIDCSDNSAGGGTQWADGTVRVTQPQWGFIWDYGNSFYRQDAVWDIGDASTATYFTSLRECIDLPGIGKTQIRTNATLQIGALNGDWSIKGSTWHILGPTAPGQWTFMLGGTLLVYGSKMLETGASKIVFYDGIFKTKNSIFAATWETGDSAKKTWRIGSQLATLELEDAYFSENNDFTFQTSPDVMNNVQSHVSKWGIQTEADAIVVSDMLVTEAGVNDVRNWASGTTRNITLTDPRFHVTNPEIVNEAANWILEQYTCNIHVADRDGTNLGTVNIDCDSDGEGDVFDVNTDANGDIAQQDVPFKKWVGTTETLTSYSPHTFTISKAGYETLVLEGITVDHPLVWHLELQRSASINSGLIA